MNEYLWYGLQLGKLVWPRSMLWRMCYRMEAWMDHQLGRVSCNTSGIRADYHTTTKAILGERTYILCGWTAAKYQVDHSSYWWSASYLDKSRSSWKSISNCNEIILWLHPINNGDCVTVYCKWTEHCARAIAHWAERAADRCRWCWYINRYIWKKKRNISKTMLEITSG